jgi:hypothetical protein
MAGTSLALIGALMEDRKKVETIENIFENFLQQMEKAPLSTHLVAIYKEFGIEP